ncbi:hypothetical protein EV2_024466 [Malus domestica]
MTSRPCSRYGRPWLHELKSQWNPVHTHWLPTPSFAHLDLITRVRKTPNNPSKGLVGPTPPFWKDIPRGFHLVQPRV